MRIAKYKNNTAERVELGEEGRDKQTESNLSFISLSVLHGLNCLSLAIRL